MAQRSRRVLDAADLGLNISQSYLCSRRPGCSSPGLDDGRVRRPAWSAREAAGMSPPRERSACAKSRTSADSRCTRDATEGQKRPAHEGTRGIAREGIRCERRAEAKSSQRAPPRDALCPTSASTPRPKWGYSENSTCGDLAGGGSSLVQAAAPRAGGRSSCSFTRKLDSSVCNGPTPRPAMSMFSRRDPFCIFSSTIVPSVSLVCPCANPALGAAIYNS